MLQFFLLYFSTVPNPPTNVQIVSSATTPVSLTVSINNPAGVYGQYRVSYKADGGLSFIEAANSPVSSRPDGPAMLEISGRVIILFKC